jgi:hypothetical protein
VTFFNRFESMPIEKRLAPMYRILEDTVQFFGPVCPDVATIIASVVHTAATAVSPQPLPPRMGEWITFAYGIRNHLRASEVIRYLDSTIRLASLTLLETKPQLEILSEASLAALNSKLGDDIHVCDCVFSYVVGALEQNVPDEEIIQFMSSVQGSAESAMANGPKAAMLLLVTLESIKSLFFFTRGPLEVGMRKFMWLMNAHGRSTAAPCAYLMGLFLSKIVTAAVNTYTQTKRPFDTDLRTVLIAICEYYLFFVSSKLIELREGEYESDYGPELIPFLKLYAKPPPSTNWIFPEPEFNTVSARMEVTIT